MGPGESAGLGTGDFGQRVKGGRGQKPGRGGGVRRDSGFPAVGREGQRAKDNGRAWKAPGRVVLFKDQVELRAFSADGNPLKSLER